MKTMKYTLTGVSPLLMNNPQTSYRFNKYAKRKAEITAKGKRRTDEDYLEYYDIEVRSKIYWDGDIGVYVPSTWVSASIESVSNIVAKIGKAKMRGIVFANEEKLPLCFELMDEVKSPVDIVKNEKFRHRMLLKQGQSKLAKHFPIFHKWSFSGSIDYEETEVDTDSLVRMFERAARYGGYGDFRQRFGKATVEIEHV